MDVQQIVRDVRVNNQPAGNLFAVPFVSDDTGPYLLSRVECRRSQEAVVWHVYGFWRDEGRVDALAARPGARC